MMLKKNNILFILPTLPWPLEFGGNQAMFNGIATLVDVANVYITYIVYGKEKNTEQKENMIKELGGKVTVLPYVEVPKINTCRKIFKLILQALDKWVFTKDIDCFLEKQIHIKQPSNGEITFINKIIENYKIDIVQVEMLSHLAIVNSLPQTVRKVFVHHELGYVRVSQILKENNCNNYYHSLAATSKIEEIALLNKYDDIIVLSEIDKQKLVDEGVKAHIHASFAIVETPDTFNPIIDDYHNIVFIGPSQHKPNFYAIKWFLDNCWNALLKTDSKFKLLIVGKWDKTSINQISKGYKNLNFMGFVKDLHTVLQNGIMIVPLTIGSGIRMKILEAAANGIPVVSTTIGAEGLPLTDGTNGYLADEPESFVNRIISLSNQTLRLQFVNNLNSIIRDQYSFDALKQNRRKILGL